MNPAEGISHKAAEASLEEILEAAPIPNLPEEGSELREEIEFIAKEDGVSPEEKWRELRLREREKIQDNRNWTSTGIPGDAFNIWNATIMATEAGDMATLKKIPSYVEYEHSQHGHDPASLAYILGRSNADTVVRLDALATTFNADIERIRSQNDVEALRLLASHAYEIIRGQPAKI